MKELVDQIEFLHTECQKNQQVFESLKTQFGNQNMHLFEKPLMINTRTIKSIIRSLEELNRLKSGL